MTTSLPQPPAKGANFSKRLGPSQGTPQRDGLQYGMIALAIIGILLLFATAMTQSANYDEDQFIAAGVMARHLMPYRDFVYLQAPLYPFVLATLFTMSGSYFLLTARLLTFTLSVASAVLLWRLLRRLGAGKSLAAVMLAACLTSPFLYSTLSNTRNDALPLTLMLAGLSMHSWTDRQVGIAAFSTSAAAALLFGLAVEAKVSYLFGPVALGVHAMFAPRGRLPPFLLGTLIAIVPAMLCYYAAPEAFRFGVLDYHLTAPVDWYGRNGLGAMLRWPARLQALLEWLLIGGNLSLLMLGGALLIAIGSRRRLWTVPQRLHVGLLAGAVILGFLPSPAWAMYYAAVPSLMACCIAPLDNVARPPANTIMHCILKSVAVLPVITMLWQRAPEVALLGQISRWPGINAHRIAVAIHDSLLIDNLVGSPAQDDIATLFPSLVVDASPLRPEFASGPFVFRSGNLYLPDLLVRLHALSPGTLDAAFARQPPAAIYAGLYDAAWKLPMDAALIQYAEEHGWQLVRTDPGGARLWLRP